MKKLIPFVFLSMLSLMAFNLSAEAPNPIGIYKKPDVFVKEAFKQNPPKPSVLWIKGNVKKQVTQILGHKYPKLRVKYWKQGTRTVWILDEIGKEKPITTGVVINNNRVEKVEVLVFRESRGWEVKYPFFTNQFIQITLKSVSNTHLNKHIDGVTGATLSVNALKVQTRMALYLHNIVNKNVKEKK